MGYNGKILLLTTLCLLAEFRIAPSPWKHAYASQKRDQQVAVDVVLRRCLQRVVRPESNPQLVHHHQPLSKNKADHYYYQNRIPRQEGVILVDLKRNRPRLLSLHCFSRSLPGSNHCCRLLLLRGRWLLLLWSLALAAHFLNKDDLFKVRVVGAHFPHLLNGDPFIALVLDLFFQDLLLNLGGGLLF